jgi:hypothetical protein
MADWEPIFPDEGEWAAVDPRGVLPANITAGQITDDKLASGIDPRKLQLFGAKVYVSANQATADAVAELLVFDTAVFDQGALHTGSTWTVLTIPFDGVWSVIAQVTWESNSTGDRQVFLQVNGVNLDGCAHNRAAAVRTRQNVPVARRFEAGDTIGVSVTQSSTGNLDVIGGENNASLSAVFMGSI